MQRLTIIISAIFLIVACKKQVPVNYSLKMDLQGLHDTTDVFLLKHNGNRYVPFDTARTDKQGFLIFTKTVTTPDYFLLKLPNGQELPMVLSALPTFLQADPSKLIQSAIFSNNLASDQIRRSILLTNEFGDSIQAIAKQLTDTLLPKPTPELHDSLIRYIDTLRVKFATRLESIILESPSPGMLPAILQHSGNQTIASPQRNRQLFIETDTFLWRHYPQNKLIERFHYQLDSAFNRIDSINSVSRGEQLPDAGLINLWGEHISLFKFRGHPLLIVVWSPNDPFSQPLIQQSHHIIKEYKPQGMDVYMVAVDSIKENWTTAIDQNRLACWHVSDLKGMNSPLLHTWGIRSIPATFVLDEEGKIVARNLEGDELIKCIEKLLDPKKHKAK